MTSHRDAAEALLKPHVSRIRARTDYGSEEHSVVGYWEAVGVLAEQIARIPPCDGGCSQATGPEETCSQHGRPTADVWTLLDNERIRNQLLEEQVRILRVGGSLPPEQADETVDVYSGRYPSTSVERRTAVYGYKYPDHPDGRREFISWGSDLNGQAQADAHFATESARIGEKVDAFQPHITRVRREERIVGAWRTVRDTHPNLDHDVNPEGTT